MRSLKQSKISFTRLVWDSRRSQRGIGSRKSAPKQATCPQQVIASYRCRTGTVLKKLRSLRGLRPWTSGDRAAISALSPPELRGQQHVHAFVVRAASFAAPWQPDKSPPSSRAPLQHVLQDKTVRAVICRLRYHSEVHTLAVLGIWDHHMAASIDGVLLVGVLFIRALFFLV